MPGLDFVLLGAADGAQMRPVTLLGLLGTLGLLTACNQPAPKAVAPAPQPAPTQTPAKPPAAVSTDVAALTQEGLLACAEVLRGQGFFVKEKEIDAPLYEFDAIKDNQEWKVKMSGNCEIVLQKLD